MWGRRTRRQLIRKDGQDIGVGARERNPLELGGGRLDDDVGLHAVRRPPQIGVGREQYYLDIGRTDRDGSGSNLAAGQANLRAESSN